MGTTRGRQQAVQQAMGPFSIMPHWLLRALVDQPHALSAIMVWGALHRWLDYDAKRCWPSVRSIADQADISERAVRYGIAVLCNVGALTVKSRSRKTGGGMSSNEYHLHYDEPTTLHDHAGAPPARSCTPLLHDRAPHERYPRERHPDERELSAPAPTDISSPPTTTNPAEDQMRDYDDGSDIRPINQSEEDFTLASRPGTPALRLRKYFEREWLIALGKRPRLSERVANVATPVAAFQKALKDILRHSTEEQVRKMMDRFFLAIVSEQKDVSSEYPLWRQFLAQRQGTTSTAAQPRRLTRNVPWDK